MASASIEFVLTFSVLLFNVLALARVVQLRLIRAHPFFSLYLAIPVVPQTALVFFGSASRPYFKVWEIAEPVRNIIYILAVWELFSLVFRSYAGLRSLGRWAMGMGAVFAPVGLLLTIVASESQLTYGITRLIVRFERGVACGLVIFIVLLLFVISRYPIQLPQNTIVISMVYATWFIGDAAVLTISSYVPQTWGYGVCNGALELVEIGCYLSCAVLLSKSGEFKQSAVRHNIAPYRERLLIEELAAINEVLLKAGHTLSRR